MLLARQLARGARYAARLGGSSLAERCAARLGGSSLAERCRSVHSLAVGIRLAAPAALGRAHGLVASGPLLALAPQPCAVLPKVLSSHTPFCLGAVRSLAVGYHGPPRRSAWKVKQRKLPRSQRKNKLRTHHGVMKRFFVVKVKGPNGIVKTGYAHTRSGKQHLQAGNRRKADRKKRRLKVVTTKGHISKLRKLLPHGVRRQRLS